MLHRSFKPAKCKTSLKLAASRIKLLKNKREAQVKQLKRELAQLLDAGQDQTARIRVEHVVREEKTMAAYELIEIYCELIVARLPIIESQKNCPIDLKEAVSSVIFASPRCADVPELMDIRKHFTAKYGKEFVSAAVELRPDCGVSRLLVEKLSAKAPDGPTKMKILTAIAEDHNVKWDPKSFGEKDAKPPEDMLNGPNTFEQATKVHAEPTNVQASPDRVDEGAHNFHDPSQHYVKHDVPANSHGSNLRSSPYSYPDHRPLGNQSGVVSGPQSWNMEFKDATAAAQAAAESAERASMAARAAAELSSQGRITRQHLVESEKAFAFASRDVGPQNYTKLQVEDVAKDQISDTVDRRHSGIRREEREGNEQDDLAGLTKRFYNLKSPNKPTQSASSKSSNASVDDYPLNDDLPMPDRHSRKRSSELGEASVKQESSESEVSVVSKLEDGMTSENVGYFEEARISKQSSSVSWHSHSQTFSDDHNVFSNINQQKMGDETDKDPFIIDDEAIQRDAKGTNSDDNAVVFDDSASDKEFKFDAEDGHNGQGYDSDFSSGGRKSSSHLLANTDAWGPRKNMDEFRGKSSSQMLLRSAFFSEDLTTDPVPSQPHDLLPMTFDDSDGASSEREVELDTYEVVGGSSMGIFAHTKSVYTRNSDPMHSGSPHSIRSSLADEENLGSNRNTHLQTSSLDSDVEEVFSKKNQGTGVDVETDNKFAYGNLDTSQASPILVKFCTSSNDSKDNLQTSGHPLLKNVQNYELPITTKNAEPIEESNLETGKELNLGILTGGLRNKGYRHPPYHRNLSNNASSSEQAMENTYSRTGQLSSLAKVDIGSGAHDQETHNQILHPKVEVKTSPRTPATYYDDNSDEEVPQQHFSNSQRSYGQKSVIEGNERSSTRTSFDLDNRDSEVSKQISSSKTHLSTGFSRRTKASPSDKDSSSKSSVSADFFVERTPSSSSSYTADTQSIPQSRSSGYQGSPEQYRSTEEAASKRIQQSKRSLYEKSSSRSSDATAIQQKPPSQSKKSSDYWASSRQPPRSAEQAASKQISESKRSLREENMKSSAQEQPFSSPKTVATDSAPSSKTSSTHGETPSRENSINKASHVHPKLPDYDTFAAHLLSLRQNRQ